MTLTRWYASVSTYLDESFELFLPEQHGRVFIILPQAIIVNITLAPSRLIKNIADGAL